MLPLVLKVTVVRNREVDRLAGLADAAGGSRYGGGAGSHCARGGLRSVEIMAASTP
jgi:hypothetical protein